MSKKSTTETGPSAYAKPYIAQAQGALTNAYNQNAGAIQNIASNIQGLNPQMMEQYKANTGNVNAARGYIGDVLGGKYMKGNPYLEQNLADTRSQTLEDVGSMFAGAGRYGSGQSSRIAADRIAAAENQARMANYENEMGRMGQAAAAAPQMSAADLDALLKSGAAGAEMAYAGVNPYVAGTQGLMGGYTTSTSKQPLLPSLLQAGATLGAGFAMRPSDRRLKTNIKKIGEFADGLGKYTWNYIWGGPEQEGVMADEVATLRPWALGPVVDGYMTVNYGAL